MTETSALTVIQQPDASLAQQSRQRAQRSHAYGLLANSAGDAEISKAITDALRDDLEIALEAVMEEERPAHPDQLAAAIGTVVGLIGADWHRAAREEFIALAGIELSGFPGHLVLDALARARRRVTSGRFLVSWVADDVEPKADKLRLERERLLRLADLAVPAA